MRGVNGVWVQMARLIDTDGINAIFESSRYDVGLSQCYGRDDSDDVLELHGD